MLAPVRSFADSSWVTCVNNRTSFSKLHLCFHGVSNSHLVGYPVHRVLCCGYLVLSEFRNHSEQLLLVFCKSGQLFQTCRPSCSSYRLEPWLSSLPFLLPLCFAGSARDSLRGFAYLSKLSTAELHPQSLSIFYFEARVLLSCPH